MTYTAILIRNSVEVRSETVVPDPTLVASVGEQRAVQRQVHDLYRDERECVIRIVPETP